MRMACEAVQMWSLSGLVAAFLDLAVAYLLLCASAVVYFASKFLGFFGLSLPCPCDGMFFNIHSKNLCLNTLLVDLPSQKVSDVQLSVKHKYPFSNSVSPKKYDHSIGGDNCANGILEIEGEGSCSSVSDARRPADDVIRREISAKAGRYDVRGNGVTSYRPRSRLRKHRKTGGLHGKYSSVSSCDPSLYGELISEEPYCHSTINNKEAVFIGGGSFPDDDFETHHFEYVDDDGAPTKIRVRHRAVTTVKMNHSPDENMLTKKSILSSEELQDNSQEVQSFSSDDENAITLLEQTLEEERIARAVLYSELEKERSAAATAADEAMAMILRLQEEKASIEMEARQYQRMIEEKSSYDAEEMDILKEILVRREMEKHFLEKEVEAYRRMVFGENEEPTVDCSENNDDALQLFGSSLDPDDDPVLILHKLAASTDKKVTLENKHSDGVGCMDKPNSSPYLENESPMQYQDQGSGSDKQGNSDEKFMEIGSMDLQEKEIISVDNTSQMTSKGSQECKKTMSLDAKELEEIQKTSLGDKLVEKNIVTCNGTETSDLCNPQSLKQRAKGPLLKSSNSCDAILDDDPHVHDVHIIADGINFFSEANVAKNEQISVSSSSEVDVRRSSSGLTHGLPPIGPRSSSGTRRSSMSSVDNEMLKIDSEVGQLRERLKLVQEERKKLSFSVENRERESIQLKLLEDIARQIQEIRHLTGPGRAVRQVSLPLPTSKGLSKKRRSRSVSSGIHRSSEGLVLTATASTANLIHFPG